MRTGGRCTLKAAVPRSQRVIRRPPARIPQDLWQCSTGRTGHTALLCSHFAVNFFCCSTTCLPYMQKHVGARLLVHAIQHCLACSLATSWQLEYLIGVCDLTKRVSTASGIPARQVSLLSVYALQVQSTGRLQCQLARVYKITYPDDARELSVCMLILFGPGLQCLRHRGCRKKRHPYVDDKLVSSIITCAFQSTKPRIHTT